MTPRANIRVTRGHWGCRAKIGALSARCANERLRNTLIYQCNSLSVRFREDSAMTPIRDGSATGIDLGQCTQKPEALLSSHRLGLSGM